MTMRTDTLTRRQDIYRDAIAVMAECYAGELTVEAVAHSIGTSRRQLQRVFDEVGGVSFRGVLTRIRMRNASILLRETDTAVATVARRVGYSQPAQFAKTFRRLYGASPSVYRTSPLAAAAVSTPPDTAARRPQIVPPRYGVGMGRRANAVQIASSPL